MHESAHPPLFSNRRANDLVGKWLGREYPALRPDRPVPARGAWPTTARSSVRTSRTSPLYRGYPIPHGLVPAQAHPRSRARHHRVEARRGTVPRALTHQEREGAGAGTRASWRCSWRMLGLFSTHRPPVDWPPAVVPPPPHPTVARDQPAGRDRRARRDAAVGRPARDHALGPPAPPRPAHEDRTILHGLAPGPSAGRHRHPNAQPPQASTRSSSVRATSETRASSTAATRPSGRHSPPADPTHFLGDSQGDHPQFPAEME